ncbi:hypothetical protein VB712_05635 [Spirulina sp. CCNP1310]|uniref:hypothetical protein n=1 Tax=Spirulina sp. CCNP1310 TaxID=3110249 RepID=UPI002B2129C2|nr:hypothetical protein [Spirulina sp. CCNP1310]MEA5418700.1 hypothetical protein [Spirulina sp. CCNP1310]
MTAENATAQKQTIAPKEAPKPKLPETKTEQGSIQVYQSGGMPLPQGRPIEISHLNIVGTYNSMGIRPVTSGTFEISSSMVVSGNRPIAKSSLVISKDIVLMGNRPVASNEIEDIKTLIGYLD